MLETHFTGTNNQTSKQKDFSKQEERNQKMEEAEVGRKLGEGLVGSNNYRILSSKEKKSRGFDHLCERRFCVYSVLFGRKEGK